MVLDSGKAGATEAPDVDGGYACLDESPRRGPIDSGTRLFRDDRNTQLVGEARDGRQPPARVRIAFRHDRLLQGVKMDAQGMCVDHLHSRLGMARGGFAPRDDLGQAEVGEARRDIVVQ